MKTFEKILVSLALILLLFTFQSYLGLGILKVLIFSTLSIFYLTLSFKILRIGKIKNETPKETLDDEVENLILDKDEVSMIKDSVLTILGTIVMGMIYSTATFGILFRIQLYPGSSPLLNSSILFLILSILSTLLFVKKNKVLKHNILIRSSVFLCLCFIFSFIKGSDIINMRYRDNPEFKNARLKVYQDPNCYDCQVELERLQQKHP